MRALVSALRVMAGVLLAASVLLNFANVIGRYFFNASIYWAEEVMLFLMVACVFLGNGVVAWSGRQACRFYKCLLPAHRSPCVCPR